MKQKGPAVLLGLLLLTFVCPTGVFASPPPPPPEGDAWLFGGSVPGGFYQSEGDDWLFGGMDSGGLYQSEGDDWLFQSSGGNNVTAPGSSAGPNSASGGSTNTASAGGAAPTDSAGVREIHAAGSRTEPEQTDADSASSVQTAPEAVPEQQNQAAELLPEEMSNLIHVQSSETPIDESAAVIGSGAVLLQASYWTGSDFRAEHYIELSADASLRPMVVSADPLTATGSLTAMAAQLEERGLHVAAGINGGFYTMSNGVPVGIVVRDGVLRSDDDGLSAVGFRADGSAVLGKPEVRLRLDAAGENLPVSTLNHTRGDGLALFSPDFSAATSASGSGWNVICVPDRSIPMSGTVTLTVERVENADGPIRIPSGRMVLSQSDALGAAPTWMAGLTEGDTLTLRVSCAPGWENVESAVCILYPLIENGQLLDTQGASAGVAPRTAVGIRADGSVVLYTVDGRQSGYSIGAGLGTVAKRLQELGCITAGALDGGASTQLRAVLPGETELGAINRPSGSTARNVVNYIFLVTDAKPTGTPARLALYPLDIDALPGAEIPLTVKAVDENGYPAPVPGDIAWGITGGLGKVVDGVYYAEGNGSGVLTVFASGVASASIPLSVIAEPESLSVYGEQYGKQISSLTLEPGQEVDLTARAIANHVVLDSTDNCFVWSLDPSVGTVDDTGHLTPGNTSGSGTLTVHVGSLTERIPITVQTGLPFRDVSAADPRFDAMKYVYDHQLFNGTGDNAFEPDAIMTRGMLVTVLWRMNGEPAVESWPGFRDVSKDDWYGPAVAWAVERGIVEGISSTQFAPLDELTKEQIVTILWRYDGEPEARKTELSEASLIGVSPYAREAMLWALTPEHRLLDRENENSAPQAAMSRSGVADVLMRYLSDPIPVPETAEPEDTDTPDETEADTSEKQDADASEKQDTDAPEKQDAEQNTEPAASQAAAPQQTSQSAPRRSTQTVTQSQPVATAPEELSWSKNPTQTGPAKSSFGNVN